MNGTLSYKGNIHPNLPTCCSLKAQEFLISLPIEPAIQLSQIKRINYLNILQHAVEFILNNFFAVFSKLNSIQHNGPSVGQYKRSLLYFNTQICWD